MNIEVPQAGEKFARLPENENAHQGEEGQGNRRYFLHAISNGSTYLREGPFLPSIRPDQRYHQSIHSFWVISVHLSPLTSQPPQGQYNKGS